MSYTFSADENTDRLTVRLSAADRDAFPAALDNPLAMARGGGASLEICRSGTSLAAP